MEIETKFKKFLLNIGAIDIDSLPHKNFPNNKADYYLERINSIFEIKTINSDRSDSLEPWLQKKVETCSEVKNGMPVLFGEVLAEQIYNGHTNKDLLHKQLDSLAARTLESYVRSAKYQIYETKKSLGRDNAFGFLVILNEVYDFYDTGFVYRIIQGMLQEISANQPHLKIHGAWYINESNVNEKIVEVAFIHEPEDIGDLSPNEILSELARDWASYRGYVTD